MEAKQAIDLAFDTIYQYYDKSDLKDLLLEEVVFKKKKHLWLITLGFNVSFSKKNDNQLNMQFNLHHDDSDYIRKYKVFKIDEKSKNLPIMTMKHVD